MTQAINETFGSRSETVSILITKLLFSTFKKQTEHKILKPGKTIIGDTLKIRIRDIPNQQIKQRLKKLNVKNIIVSLEVFVSPANNDVESRGIAQRDERDVYLAAQLALPVLNSYVNLYEKIYKNLRGTVRHEFEHIFQQFDENENTTKIDNASPLTNKEAIEFLEYYTNPDEIKAYVVELYLNAKKQRIKFTELLNTFLHDLKQNFYKYSKIENDEIEYVIEQIHMSWLNYAKQRFQILN